MQPTKSMTTGPAPSQNQLTLEEIRKQMQERLATQKEKKAPQITEVTATGSAGCARWYNL